MWPPQNTQGVEGLVHVSEMSWTKKNVHPGKIVSTSQEVDVQVLEVDQEKRRISLGIKQVQDNPWDSFSERFPVGSTKKPFRITKKATKSKPKFLKLISKKSVSLWVSNSLLKTQCQLAQQGPLAAQL